MFAQELHNPERLVTWATTFGTLTPATCGSSAWSLLIATLLTPRILQIFRDFRENLWKYEKSHFLSIMQRVVVIADVSRQPIRPKTSVRNYHNELRNKPVGRCAYPPRVGSLKLYTPYLQYIYSRRKSLKLYTPYLQYIYSRGMSLKLYTPYLQYLYSRGLSLKLYTPYLQYIYSRVMSLKLYTPYLQYTYSRGMTLKLYTP